MPGRLIPLVTGEIYHIFNRGIDHRPTFTNKTEHQRAVLTLFYYQFTKPRASLSTFLRLDIKQREEARLALLVSGIKGVEILCFCLMPNHFHLLVKQTEENGISKFLGNFQNSFTRFFNKRNGRIGPLFLDQFKAVRVENEPQLLHLSRYIHLNPYTSAVVKSLDALEAYGWSSLKFYLGMGGFDFCSDSLVLSFFKNKELYKAFLFDQADYQRELHLIKHLLLET